MSVRSDGVSDGPFLKTDQVVAGIYVIEARDWDEALTIAATDPAISGDGGLEVRLIHSGGIIEG